MNNNKKYALISVYDKKNLKKICETLTKYNIGLISTGSTRKEIKKNGFICDSVSNLTKFKEILEGRVKTLNHNIHASILYNRKKQSHISTFNKLKFPIIDFVIVNLYPFERIIEETTNLKKCIEMIDIGGPALLRSAAKNFESVTAINNIDDYENFIKNLEINKGKTSLLFRKKMAKKVFITTYSYDSVIANWFSNNSGINLNGYNAIKLKYGENQNQKSTFYHLLKDQSFFKSKIQGKELGYNNILDINSGLDCINEFSDPTCVIIKHNNPCGISSNKSINNAFKDALDSDKVSAFGGVVIINRIIDKKLANLISKNFFEIIISTNYTKDAKSIFKKKPKLILIETSKLSKNNKNEITSVIGGYLIQEKNKKKIIKKDLFCMTNKKVNTNILNDFVFALKVSKHVKSNAIVLVKNKKTIGIGAGQMSRIDSTKLAIMKAKSLNKKMDFVAASDAFFPFTDNIKLLIKNKCKGIVQPSGSINDHKIIKFADNNNLPLYFTKYRLFKH